MGIRRATLGVSAAGLALLMSACSSTSSSTATTAAAGPTSAGTGTSSTALATSDAAATTAVAGAPVTLNLWKWSALSEPALQSVIDAYKKVAPNVTIKVNALSQDDYKPKVPLALNSGEPIDILAVQPSAFAQQISSNLMPVDDWTKFMPAGALDKIEPATLDQAKKLFSDGKNYVLPFGSSGSAVAYYNAAMLKEVGVEPPKTWAEMQALAKVLKVKKPGVAVAVMPSGADSWFQDELVLTLAGQNDKDFFNNVRYNKGKWNVPAYADALKAWQGMYASGAMDKDVVDLGYSDAMTAFQTGKAAIVFNGSWEAPMLSEAVRKEKKIDLTDVGAMPVPALTDPANRGLRGFLDMGWAIPKASKNAEEAAKFIAFITTGDGVNLWAKDLDLIPVVKGWTVPDGVLTSAAAKDGFAAIQSMVANPRSDRNNLSAFSAEVGKKIMDVINGADPAKAAAAMQDDLDSGKFN